MSTNSNECDIKQCNSTTHCCLENCPDRNECGPNECDTNCSSSSSSSKDATTNPTTNSLLDSIIKDENFVNKDAGAVPSTEQLTDMLEKIKKMNPKERNQLLANLKSGNSVNPNSNEYSNMTPKEIARAKLKNKLKIMQSSRNTKSVQKSQITKKMKLKKNKVVPTPVPTVIDSNDLEQIQKLGDESTEDSDTEEKEVTETVV